MPLDQLATSVVFSIVVAIAVSLWLEWLRRPRLEVRVGKLREDEPWTIAHLQVRNVPLAERGPTRRWLARFVLTRPADGTHLQLSIDGDALREPLQFAGKWTSRHEPVNERGLDVQKLPGIHHVSLQPDTEDQVAVAIRPRGRPAYAYWAERIYDGPQPFPVAPACVLSPGTYSVAAQAAAGELRSERRVFLLVVAEQDDSIFLSAP